MLHNGIPFTHTLKHTKAAQYSVHWAAGDSSPFSSIVLALSFLCSRALSMPAPPPVEQTVRQIMDHLSLLGQGGEQRMKTDWNSMRAMSLSALIVRLGLVGAFAGLVAWLTVLGLHLLFEVSRPSWLALLLAIPRGAVVGMILALVLHAYWKRHPGTGGMKGQ